MKLESKNLAVTLRLQGKTYSEILRKVKVSKSSLNLWLRDIDLTKNQEERILEKSDKARYLVGKMKTKQRIAITKEIINKAKAEFSSLIKNPLFLIGLSLYWAEGDKHRAERVKFTNSDPHTVAVMMRWFREVCLVKEEKFRVALHIHNLMMNSDVKKFWHELTKIPLNQFNKLYIKQTTLRQRRNVLYNGTCGIVVGDRALFRRILGWKLAAIDTFCPRRSMDRTRAF